MIFFKNKNWRKAKSSLFHCKHCLSLHVFALTMRSKIFMRNMITIYSRYYYVRNSLSLSMKLWVGGWLNFSTTFIQYSQSCSSLRLCSYFNICSTFWTQRSFATTFSSGFSRRKIKHLKAQTQLNERKERSQRCKYKEKSNTVKKLFFRWEVNFIFAFSFSFVELKSGRKSMRFFFKSRSLYLNSSSIKKFAKHNKNFMISLALFLRRYFVSLLSEF